MAEKTFPEMIGTLRAGSLAGMATTITLNPSSAALLADILEAEQERRLQEVRDAVAYLYSPGANE